MPISRGAIEIPSIYRGSTEILSVYKGTTSLYESVWTPASLFKTGDTGDWWDYTDANNVWTNANGTGSHPTSTTRVKSSVGLVNSTLLGGTSTLPEWYSYPLNQGGTLGGIGTQSYPGGQRVAYWNAGNLLAASPEYTILQVCQGGSSTSTSETSMGWVAGANVFGYEHRTKGSFNDIVQRSERSNGNTGSVRGSAGGPANNTDFAGVFEFFNGGMAQYYTGQGFNNVLASSTAYTSTTHSGLYDFNEGFGYGSSTAAASWATFHSIVIDRRITAYERQRFAEWSAAILGVTP